MRQSRLRLTPKNRSCTERERNNEASIEEPRYGDKVYLPEVNKKAIETKSTRSLLLPRASSDQDKISHHALYPATRFKMPGAHESLNQSRLSQARSLKKRTQLPPLPARESSFIDLTEDDSDEKTFSSERTTTLGPSTPPSPPIITEDGPTSHAAVSDSPKTQDTEMTMTHCENTIKSPPSILPTPESSPTSSSNDGNGKPSRSIYLRHFEEALDTVMHARPDYASLFTLEEQQVARKFASLGLASRNLYVRLFQRKGPWFRTDSMMGYDEIGTATPLWLRNREAAAAAASSGLSTTTAEKVGLDRDTLPWSPFAQEDGDQAQREQQEGEGNAATSASEPSGVQPGVKPLTLSRQELTALHWHIQSALQELIDAGFLSTLPADGSCTGRDLEVTLAAVECCMKSPEVKTLLSKMGNGKTPSRLPRSKARRRESNDDYPAERSETAAASGGKRAMVQELRQRLTGQRTLWGTKLPLVREIGHLISDAVRSLGVDLPQSGQVRGTGVRESGREQGQGRKQNQIHGAVLMTELPRMIFKRVLRLLYLTCNTGALSSGEVGAASVRGASVTRAMSSWSPGLSAAFGKSRYASYACDVRTRIFRGREDFLRWEAAVELRCALDKTIAELPRGWANAPDEAKGTDVEDGSGGGPGVLVSRDDKHIAAEDNIEKRTRIVRGKQGSDEDGGKEESIAAPAELEEYCSRFIEAEGGGIGCVGGRDVACKSASPAVAIALACSRCLRAQEMRRSGGVGPGDGSGILQAADVASKRVSDEAVNEILKVACNAADRSAHAASPSFSSRGVTADLSGGGNIRRVPSPSPQLSTKIEREGKSVTAGISTGGAEGNGMRSGRELSSDEHGGRSDDLPCFLLQLEAGWVLASAVWEGVVLLERARDYGRAVELLAQLLATRYTPHRRGRWWNRLSLDLAHCGRVGCALWAVEEGLRDPRVNGGDRITLGKRRSMLTVRINKSAEAARSSDISREADGDGGETGDNDDDDDEIFKVPVAKRARRSKRRRGQGQPGAPRRSTDTPASKISGTATMLDLAGSEEAGRAGESKEVDRVSHEDVSHGHDGVAGVVDDGLGDTSEMPLGHTVPVAAAPPSLPIEIQLKRSVLAELSEVPDLIRDESIGVVVLATTLATATGKGERPGEGRGPGDGVPEISVIGRRLNRQVGVKSRYVGYGDGAVCTVESLVLQHLSQGEEGSWAGWHCEGSPLRALWALLMWDLLFMDVPDVFQTPFQDAPLDLDFCPLFYLNRREAVDARLAMIRAASPARLSELVSTAWTANAYTVCRGIRWEATSVRFLQVVAAGLGGRALASALAALSLNNKHFGGGLPDLLLMRAVRTPSVVGTNIEDAMPDAVPGRGAEAPTEVSTPDGFISWIGVDTGAFCEDKAMASEGIVRGDRSPLVRSEKSKDLPPPFERRDLDGLRIEVWLLEVKGPSDHLSDRQTAWLRILHEGGARVGVCHVTEGEGGNHAPRRSRTN